WPGGLVPRPCLYFVAGKLGLSLAFVHASATAVWPPTGIALAALRLHGPQMWPAIFLGSFRARQARGAARVARAVVLRPATPSIPNGPPSGSASLVGTSPPPCLGV